MSMSNELKTSDSAATLSQAEVATPLEDLRRVRPREFANLLGVGRTTLYSGLKTGRYPRPNGYDGDKPYWFQKEVRAFLSRNSDGGNGHV